MILERLIFHYPDFGQKLVFLPSVYQAVIFSSYQRQITVKKTC